MSKPRLSRAAHARLTEELEQLRTQGRADAAGTMSGAGTGDPADQAFAVEAFAAAQRLEERIRTLEERLADSEVVDGIEVGDTVVEGCVVSVTFDGDDAAERYLVGSIDERPDDVVVLTPSSPMGRALLGARTGDVVSFAAPSGQLQVTVTAIGA